MSLLGGGISSFGFKQILRRTSNLINVVASLQKSTNVNAIDCFATEIAEKQLLKWEIVKRNVLDKYTENKNSLKGGITIVTKSIQSDYESLKKSELWLDIRKLSTEQLDNLLSTALDLRNNEDIFYLIKQCIRWKILPSLEVSEKCLEYLSSMGEWNIIDDFVALYKERDPSTLIDYGNFTPYKIIALWKCGNIESTLSVLIEFYQKNYEVINKTSRNVFHSALKIISNETLNGKSEAVLICLLKSAELIYRNFHDIFLIGCIWKNCFGSEWFSDQQIAGKLFDDYPELRDIVYKRTISLCYNFLRDNNVDAVHRLIQLLLLHENKDACKSCLNLLFEYNYWRRDLRACSEIIRNSIELDIQLSQVKVEKLLNLLLNQPMSLAMTPTVEKFEYKF